MLEETKLIQPAPVIRDENGWWHHPGIPDFGGTEDPAPYKAWAAEQGLELKTWDMDSDLVEHPYFEGADHCNGWQPEAPGPEWFLMGIFDTDDGPHVQWARRKEQCGACGGCTSGCRLDKDSPPAPQLVTP